VLSTDSRLDAIVQPCTVVGIENKSSVQISRILMIIEGCNSFWVYFEMSLLYSLIIPTIWCLIVPVGLAVKEGRRPLFFDILHNENIKITTNFPTGAPHWFGIKCVNMITQAFAGYN
jgi:hypothetical protein